MVKANKKTQLLKNTSLTDIFSIRKKTINDLQPYTTRELENYVAIETLKYLKTIDNIDFKVNDIWNISNTITKKLREEYFMFEKKEYGD